MTLPNPDLLFDRLAPYLPEVPAWAWRIVAGIGLLASAGVVALHHSWIGGVLLLAGALAAGAGEAVARRHGKPALPVLPLGVDTTRFRPGLDGTAVRSEAGISAGAPLVAISPFQAGTVRL